MGKYNSVKCTLVVYTWATPPPYSRNPRVGVVGILPVLPSLFIIDKFKFDG